MPEPFLKPPPSLCPFHPPQQPSEESFKHVSLAMGLPCSHILYGSQLPSREHSNPSAHFPEPFRLGPVSLLTLFQTQVVPLPSLLFPTSLFGELLFNLQDPTQRVPPLEALPTFKQSPDSPLRMSASSSVSQRLGTFGEPLISPVKDGSHRHHLFNTGKHVVRYLSHIVSHLFLVSMLGPDCQPHRHTSG